MALARRDETVEPVQLRQRAGGLHVGDLEVVAEVGVGVLVVVAVGQVAQLPAEALAAGVVLAGRAVAVAAPVAEDSAISLSSALLVNTAPPSPMVMWWAG